MNVITEARYFVLDEVHIHTRKVRFFLPQLKVFVWLILCRCYLLTVLNSGLRLATVGHLSSCWALILLTYGMDASPTLNLKRWQTMRLQNTSVWFCVPVL